MSQIIEIQYTPEITIEVSLALQGPKGDSAATDLAGLTDVDVSNKEEGQFLYFDGTKWIASGLGLGTASELDAGVPSGVATLDSGGTVPLSQIPSSIQGGLIYQGAWNASTNTPALTSSVGTKGHYYVVSIPGTINLNGITDWNVGDLAVFNGSVWEQIDNTDSVVSVNDMTGAVVLNYASVNAPSTTGLNATGTWGISVTGNAATVTNGVYTTDTGTVTNTMLAGSIANNKLANSSITINGNNTALGGSVNVGTVTSVAATAGTGISVSGSPITSNGTLTITNTAPDQVVSLTGAGTTSISGTYPNFTVTSNDQYVGTVTSVGGTGTINGITLTGSVTSSGNLTLGGALSGVNLGTQVTGTLPVDNGGTGITAFGVGVATALGTNVTGSGGIVLSTSPTLTTPNLGTPTAATLTNATGLPIVNGTTGTLSVARGGTGATSLTGLVLGNGTSAFTTVTAPSGAVVGTTDTQTLSSKRVNPRVVAAAATTGNLTINGDTTDVYKAEGLTGAITFLQPSGGPADGQRLMIRIEDNGTARGITWTTSAGAFREVGITLPTTTVSGKVTYVGCVYNSTDGFWDAIATVTQA